MKWKTLPLAQIRHHIVDDVHAAPVAQHLRKTETGTAVALNEHRTVRGDRHIPADDQNLIFQPCCFQNQILNLVKAGNGEAVKCHPRGGMGGVSIADFIDGVALQTAPVGVDGYHHAAAAEIIHSALAAADPHTHPQNAGIAMVVVGHYTNGVDAGGAQLVEPLVLNYQLFQQNSARNAAVIISLGVADVLGVYLAHVLSAQTVKGLRHKDRVTLQKCGKFVESTLCRHEKFPLGVGSKVPQEDGLLSKTPLVGFRADGGVEFVDHPGADVLLALGPAALIKFIGQIVCQGNVYSFGISMSLID